MPKRDLPKNLKLCRMGETLYLTIPKEFVLAHTLDVHDEVFWDPKSNGVLLRFDPSKIPQHAEPDPTHAR